MSQLFPSGTNPLDWGFDYESPTKIRLVYICMCGAVEQINLNQVCSPAPALALCSLTFAHLLPCNDAALQLPPPRVCASICHTEALNRKEQWMPTCLSQTERSQVGPKASVTQCSCNCSALDRSFNRTGITVLWQPESILAGHVCHQCWYSIRGHFSLPFSLFPPSFFSF